MITPARLLVIIQTHLLILQFSDRREFYKSINISFTDQEFRNAFLECRLGYICNRWVVKSPISESIGHQQTVAKFKRYTKERF